MLVDQLVDPLLVLELLLAHHQQPDKTQSTPTLREGERQRLFAGFFLCVRMGMCADMCMCVRICVCLWGRESLCACVSVGVVGVCV